MSNLSFPPVAGIVDMPPDIIISEIPVKSKKMIDLTISAHHWISIWFEHRDEIQWVNIEIEGNTQSKKAVYEPSKNGDFKTWLIENSEADILIVPSIESIDNVSDRLIEFKETIKEYSTLPAIIIFDQDGDPGITLLVDHVYEIENGSLEEIMVEW